MTTQDIPLYAQELAAAARRASRVIGAAPTAVKNAALQRFAALLRARQKMLEAANKQDLDAAAGLSAAMLERLDFGGERVEAAARAVEQIVAQDDPVGAIEDFRVMPSGIRVGKMRVPLGVVLIIYESRPNVTADAAALALMAGNAVILRGGSEARHTNAAIAACLAEALAAHNLADAAQIVANTDRAVVGALLQRNNEIDLVIPRGGRALIERVVDEAKMPVLKHLEGNCHVYIDAAADIAMATAIIENAKTRRYGVCNAAESVLAHAAVAAQALPPVAKALQAKGVELRCCDESAAHLRAAGVTGVAAATEDDWRREYLAPIISIKTVASLDAAIEHINRHGSGHTDAIISRDAAAGWRFLREVDSSSVLVNASTGFADGGEYGLGAEVGISTDKLHARGPVGAVGLTTQKYVVFGNGECRR